MNLKQLIKFGLEESSVPVIKNPILRAALEPRSTVPGPRNMYSDGQLVTPNVDGSRPGYYGKDYVKKTEDELAESYAKRNKLRTLRAEKKYKEIIDDFIEKGDYKNFKSEIYESQKKHKLPSGKWRQTKGGRVPAHIKKFITDRLDAGPGTELFKDLIRITGRTEEELLDFSSKIPQKGSQPIKQRSKKALESWPEEGKLTEEERLEGERKRKDVRKTKEKVGIKYASEAELENYRTVNNQKKALNKHFMDKPNAINNTEYGKEIKKLMETRLAGKDMELGGRKIKAGDIYRRIKDSKGNFLNDAYYKNLAEQGKIFDIFDINKMAKGQRITKQAINLNLLPGQFNAGFIEGNVDRWFKKGGKFYGDTEKLNKISKYLENIGVTVDIQDVGRIGGGEKVFFDTPTGKFPHMYNTLKKMKIPDELLTGINPPKNQLSDQIAKVFKERGITLKKGQAGFIATDILKDAGKLGPKGLRLLASDWVWPEIVIGWLDKQNMIQKGMSPERASSEMWKNMTFGLRDKGGTENAILGQLKKLGYGEKDIKAAEHMMRYGKIGKEIEKYENTLKSLEEGDVDVDSQEGAAQLAEKIKSLKKEQESVAGFYFGAIGDKDPNYGYELYDQASKELMRTEWNKSLEGRKKRIDPYAGGIGDVVQSDVFSIDAWLPQHFLGATKSKSTLAREKIEAMSDEEHLQEGIGYERVHPMYGAAMSDKQMEPLKEQMDYMYAEGGIASLNVKK